jgi:hypothetical protein
MVGVAQSGPRSGVAGARAPAVRTPGSRSLASRPSSTTTASTRATATSARPSSRRWPTRPTRSGATSPATSGPSARRSGGESASRRSTTASLHRRRRGAGRDHRQSLGRGDRALGAPLAGAPSLALQRPRPPPRLPLRARRSPAQLSDTRVFDRPRAGRRWFEQTLRDRLALGRADRVAVVSGRRALPNTPDASTPR